MRGDRHIRCDLFLARCLFAAVVLHGLGAGQSFGQAFGRRVLTAPGGTSIVDDSQLRQPRLFWKSGEFMDGQLTSADERSVSFTSELFTEPAVIGLDSLSRVDFPPSASAVPGAAFSVLLRNGDSLFADVTSINADGITLNSQRHGELKLPLSSVQVLRRLKSDLVLYSGPHGAAGWKHYGLRDAQGFPWAAAERGVMMTRVWNRSAMMEMNLPQKFEAKVVLSSDGPLRFALSFNQASNSLQQMAIETWDDELVIAQQNKFTPLRTLHADDRVVALRILCDLTTRKTVVCDWNGKVLGEFQGQSVGNEKPCVLLRNKGAQIRLEHLLVRVWDGVTMPGASVATGFIEKLDGSALAGPVTAGADGWSFMVAGQVVPLDQVMVLDAGPLDEKAMAARQVPLAQMLIPSRKGADELTSVRYSDGTSLSGRLSKVTDGTVSLTHELSAQPVLARIEGMERLSIQQVKSPGAAPEPAMETLDTMHTGSATLHGRLEGTGDAQMRWRLPGALTPVPLAKRSDLEIRRPARDDLKAAPALFFLRDGNVLGATLQSVTATDVKLKSDVVEMGMLAPDQLHAIHFNSRQKAARGFADPGWQIVKGTEADVERKGDDAIVIKGNGAMGHGTIMFGDEVQFTMSAPSFWGALEVGLFCGDLESRTKSAQLHLIFSGSDFWAVLETGENNSRSSEQLRNLTAKSIQVKLSFTEDAVQVSANGIPLMNAQLDASLRKGAGLIFAPSAMWGNPSRDVEVSNFGVQARPDFIQTPAIGEESKKMAMTIPRFKRQDPPTHVLLAPNGDMLRGRIESATATSIKFASGVESMDVPVERVAAAVWLEEPKTLGKEEPAPVKEPSKDDEFAKSIATHWLVLQDGSRLGVKVDKFMADRIIAWSPSLGTVDVPNDQLAMVKLAAPSPTTAMLAYRDWQPEFAPEPVLPETGGQSSPLLNKPAPDFALPLLGGGQFQLSAEKGKVIVLDFWATWCGPCVSSMPEQLKAMAEFDPAKVRFIAVNQGEPEPVVQKFLQARGWQMSVAFDSQQAIGAKYGVEGIPHCVVIDATGKVVWTNTGYSPGESEKMAAMIRKLLTAPQ